jgi:hypothetical protein
LQTKLFPFCVCHSKSTTLNCCAALCGIKNIHRRYSYLATGWKFCLFVELFRGAIPTYIATGGTALVRFPAGPRNFSPLYNIQTSSGVPSAPYTMCTEGDKRGGKV